jgi:hypothetical protein
MLIRHLGLLVKETLIVETQMLKKIKSTFAPDD